MVSSWKVPPPGTETEVGLKVTGSRRDAAMSQEWQLTGPAKETSKNSREHLHEEASFEIPARLGKHDTHPRQ